jgi:tetratricopeptide (TPR) repeat protein
MSQSATPDTNAAPDKQDMVTLAGLLRQRQHAEAETMARKLVGAYPSHGGIWQALGASLHAQGRWHEAVDAQRKAVALSPHDALAHYVLGDSLMALKQPVLAAQSYRLACSIKPDFADAYFKLANAMAVQNCHDEAIDAYRGALKLRPDFSQAHANLGFTLMSAHRHAEAEPHLRSALRAHPDSAPIHHALGLVLYAQARLDEATESFRRAAALMPNDAEICANLGNALRELGAFDEAEACYRRAMALNDQFARVYADLGALFYLQERYAEAEQSYRQAMALQPDDAQACNNLGRSIRRQGRLDEARKHFEAAMAIDPESVEAYCNLAALRTFTPEDPEPQRLEQLVHKLPSLSEHLRTRYWFSLGKMREDLGHYDDAFAAYAQGNRLKHAKLKPDESAKIDLLETVRNVFDERFFASHPIPTCTGASPIFIVGMPRSGTSLIEQILSTHPDVHGAGELPDLEEILFDLAAQAGKPMATFPHIVARMTTEERLRLGEAYADRVWKLAPSAVRIVDKMMANFAYVGLIRLMLPNAKIIHAMRDPMDSCFSCYATLFYRNNLDFTYDLGELGRYYVRYIELMKHWQRVLPPGSILDLRYEDMVTDTEAQARRLLDYLGLPWDPRCLDFHQNKRVVKTASAAQVRRPVYRSSVARWTHFEAHVRPLLDIVQAYR